MLKVWIDPGHGGKDGGAPGADGRNEKDDNLRYALKLRDLLESRGVGVVMTRTTDVYLTYAERCAMEAGCSLAICCHRNYNAPEATGAEIWLHSKAGDSIIAWASDVIYGLRAAGMPIRPGTVAPGVYRGYLDYPDENYYCNSGTRSPSMLVELGFLNKTDNAIFDARIDALVKAIADAACRMLGVTWSEAAPAGQDATIYRVQTGAFANKDNAERMAAELQGKGYQTIVKTEG